MKPGRSSAYRPLVLLLLIMAGCAIKPAAKDLVNYINQDIMGVSEIEAYALARYEAVSGVNYSSDAMLSQALNEDIIPVYGRFVSILKNVEPGTPEVRRLHSRYIYAAEHRLKAFETLALGLRNRDEVLVRRANSLMAEGRAAMVLWRNERLELYEKYGIETGKRRLW